MVVGNLADLASAGAAWVALGLGIWNAVSERRRQARERRAAQSTAVVLQTTDYGDGALGLTIKYRPESGHTRFRVEVTVVQPASARLSTPGWRAHEMRMLGEEFWDPKAPQETRWGAAFEEYGLPGELNAKVAVSGLERGRALLRIQITDVASGAAIYDERKFVTA